MPAELRGLNALEAWCRRVTAGYNNVKVQDLSSSWRDGLAFCAIIHHFRPDLLNFESLSSDNIFYNNQLAFSMAEEKLGIPALLDAEDMVQQKEPDRRSIALYLSEMYDCFEGKSKPPRRTTAQQANMPTLDKLSSNETNNPVHLPRQ